MANSSVCIFPNGLTKGSDISPSFVPCDPSAKHSACCAQGETCTGHGLCLSSNGLIYRGACTDSTYQDAACPSLCTAGSGSNAGTQNGFTFMKPCDASTGSLQWVCGLTGNCSNPATRFTLLVGGPTAVNITGTVSSSSSSSSSAISGTSTPTSSSTSTNTSSSNTATQSSCPSTKSGASTTAVGVGIGVALGVLLLLCLVWGFWERKGKKRALGPGMQGQVGYDTTPSPWPETQHSGSPNTMVAQPVGKSAAPNELSSVRGDATRYGELPS